MKEKGKCQKGKHCGRGNDLHSIGVTWLLFWTILASLFSWHVRLEFCLQRSSLVWMVWIQYLLSTSKIMVRRPWSVLLWTGGLIPNGCDQDCCVCYVAQKQSFILSKMTILCLYSVCVTAAQLSISQFVSSPVFILSKLRQVNGLLVIGIPKMRFFLAIFKWYISIGYKLFFYICHLYKYIYI